MKYNMFGLFAAFIADKIGDRIFEIIYNRFILDIFERRKLKILTQKIQDTVKKDFLRKYGDENFYNSLDKFFNNNGIFKSFILNSYNTTFGNYESLLEFSKRICDNFLNDSDNHSYQIEKISIEKCIKTLLYIIHNMLNDINISNEVRITVNSINNHIDEKTDEIKKILNNNAKKEENFTKEKIEILQKSVIDNTKLLKELEIELLRKRFSDF